MIVPIDTFEDSRLEDYREMKERELARRSDRFIAEGEHVVRRLCDSDFPLVSMLLSVRRAEEIAPLAPADVPVYVLSDEQIHRVVGFKFHSGVLACGRRKPSPSLDDIARRSDRLTLVILPELANTENLGALIRICAAFGVDAMVLGERSCDPFFRQSVRVSMGTVFRLPIVRSENLMRDLNRLRTEFGVELAATVLDEDAESLASVHRGKRIGLLFGNEAQGLDVAVIRACDRRITIPMKLGTDSLNVSVCAGIVLYHFTNRT